MASRTLFPQSVTLRVSMGREARPGLESQVILWATSPRQARNRDIRGEENGPGASVRGEGKAAGTGSQPGVLVTQQERGGDKKLS